METLGISFDVSALIFWNKSPEPAIKNKIANKTFSSPISTIHKVFIEANLHKGACGHDKNVFHKFSEL